MASSHLRDKVGTPTMGGILILMGFGAGTFLWANLTAPIVLWLTASTLLFGIVGFLDDFLKLRRYTHDGLKPKQKTIMQLVFALLLGITLTFVTSSFLGHTPFPFF